MSRKSWNPPTVMRRRRNRFGSILGEFDRFFELPGIEPKNGRWFD